MERKKFQYRERVRLIRGFEQTDDEQENTFCGNQGIVTRNLSKDLSLTPFSGDKNLLNVFKKKFEMKQFFVSKICKIKTRNL